MTRAFVLSGLVLITLLGLSGLTMTGCGGIGTTGGGGMVHGVLAVFRTVGTDAHSSVYEIDPESGPITLLHAGPIAPSNPPGWPADLNNNVGDNAVASNDGHFFVSHVRFVAPLTRQVIAFRPDFSTGVVSWTNVATMPAAMAPWFIKYHNGCIVAHESAGGDYIAACTASNGHFGTVHYHQLSADGQDYDGESVAVSGDYVYCIARETGGANNLHARSFRLNSTTGALTPVSDLLLDAIPSAGAFMSIAWVGVAGSEMVATIWYSAANHQIVGIQVNPSTGALTYVDSVDLGNISTPALPYLGRPVNASGYWFVGVPSGATALNRLGKFQFSAGLFSQVGTYTIDDGVAGNTNCFTLFSFRDLVYYLSDDNTGPPPAWSMHTRRVALDGSVNDPNVDGTHLLNFNTASFWRPLSMRQGRLLVHSCGSADWLSVQRTDLTSGFTQTVQNTTIAASSDYRTTVVVRP